MTCDIVVGRRESAQGHVPNGCGSVVHKGHCSPLGAYTVTVEVPETINVMVASGVPALQVGIRSSEEQHLCPRMTFKAKYSYEPTHVRESEVHMCSNDVRRSRKLGTHSASKQAEQRRTNGLAHP